MPKNKIKSHKGLKKVLNVRDGGSIKIGHPGTRHNTGKKNSASNRSLLCVFLVKKANYLLVYDRLTKRVNGRKRK